MTKSIVQLWLGNLAPVKYLEKDNTELRHLEGLMQRNLETLEDNLNEKQAAFFKKYNDCVTEYMTVLTEQAFCDGFCLGTRIMAETLLETEQ